jgi:hypothetical protein
LSRDNSFGHAPVRLSARIIISEIFSGWLVSFDPCSVLSCDLSSFPKNFLRKLVMLISSLLIVLKPNNILNSFFLIHVGKTIRLGAGVAVSEAVYLGSGAGGRGFYEEASGLLQPRHALAGPFGPASACLGWICA